MTWTELDWAALDRLREGFLRGTAGSGPYWQSESDLASYDLTYGERIGWKWDQVLRELRLRGWQPEAGTVFDWGCGSGIAARRVISAFGPERLTALRVWDHSPLAADFAATAASRAFPSLAVSQATPGFLQSDEPVGLLVISHVLNELAPAELAALRAVIGRASAVLWVEAGTRDVSRQLGALREELRRDFRVVAPCTHPGPCPILTPGNERHWCHHFAPPPSEIFANPDWVKFGQRAGVDLRSLPYCFLALDRAGRTAANGAEGWSRIIGRPEHFKPYARVLNCDATGLAELTIPKRNNPALYKELDRTKAPLVYRWQREGEKVIGGEALGS
ncbi:MAG TPA: small ribosomal subunit Rsm22 family protein [Opitutaceae bacterium]|nr:small ribosomal subunit Rsm22 family protein [Opitutaceae bacterium]